MFGHGKNSKVKKKIGSAHDSPTHNYCKLYAVLCILATFHKFSDASYRDQSSHCCFTLSIPVGKTWHLSANFRGKHNHSQSYVVIHHDNELKQLLWL